MRKREAIRLKVGDKVRLNPNLKDGRKYAGITYMALYMKIRGDKEIIEITPDQGIVKLTNQFNYSHLMLIKA